MQFDFNIDQSCAFSAYTNPMTTELSIETENQRLASLRSKQDMKALETHMRQLDLETEEARNAELQAEEAEKIAARMRNNAEIRKQQVERRHNLANLFQANTRSNSAKNQFTDSIFDDRLMSRKLEKKEFLKNVFNHSDNNFVSESNLADEEFRKNQVVFRRNLEEEFQKKHLEHLNQKLQSMDSKRSLDRTNTSVSLEFARHIALQKLAASRD
jgi:hypothetical protein